VKELAEKGSILFWILLETIKTFLIICKMNKKKKTHSFDEGMNALSNYINLRGFYKYRNSVKSFVNFALRYHFKHTTYINISFLVLIVNLNKSLHQLIIS
jgi:hypothetical protein